MRTNDFGPDTIVVVVGIHRVTKWGQQPTPFGPFGPNGIGLKGRHI